MAEATMDSLRLEVSSSSDTASKGLDALTRSLKKLQKATGKGLGLNAVVTELKTANTGISSSLGGLSKAVDILTKLGGVKISTSIGNQLNAISTAFKQANFDGGAAKMQSLVDALEPLGQLGKTNLSSYVTQLKKLPEVMTELNKLDMDALAAKMRELATALKPLGDEMQKVANGFSAFPAKIQRLIATTNRLSTSNKRASGSYTDLYHQIKMAATAVTGLARTVAGWIKKSSDYTETMNLFTVSMGQYAEEAYNYAQTVGEAMGIDPAEWMKAQGTLMTLVKGFGVAGDRASMMSQQLTQLGYDLSSFFNITVEDAMTKLESGIAGELEPLRRLGYDLSQAKLEAVALSLGIDKVVSSMTQAEKAELRYYAIMTQVTDAHGDMARTLNAPANQMRVLNAQVTQLGRALGNFFIPLLNKVLPYAIACVKVLREVLDVFMDLLGIELAEVDFGSDSITGATGDIVDNLEDAQGEAKKLKSYLLGFDELNVINSDDGSALDDLLGTGFDFDLPTYNFMEGIVEQQVDKIMEKMRPAIEWIKEHLDDIAEVVIAIGAGFLAWKFANGFESMLKAVKNAGLNKIATGITLLVTGVTLALQGGYSIGYEGATWENVLKTAIGDALIIGGSLLTFGTGPLGWTVGIGIALLATITGISIGADKKAIEEDLKSRFGEIELTSEEISTLVQATLGNEWYSDVKLYLDLKADLDGLQSQIETTVGELNKYGWKVNMGVKLTESELSNYKLDIYTFVNKANQYVTDRGYAVSVGIKATLDEGKISESIIASNETITSLVSADLAQLGSDLQDYVNEAFSDGILTIDEQKAIESLTSQINRVLEIVSQSEFMAKIDFTNMKYGSDGMTQESWEAYIGDMQSLADEMKVNAETVITNTLSELHANIALAEYYLEQDPNNEEWQAALTEAQTALQLYMDSNPLELEVNEIDAIINDQVYNQFNAMFGGLFEKASPILASTVEDSYKEAFQLGLRNPDEIYDQPIEELITNLLMFFGNEFSELDISSAERENLKKYLADCIPKQEDLEKELDDAWNAGNAIPQAVKDGLLEINTYKAMSDDATERMEGIYYIIGQALSNSPEFYDMLGKADNLGWLLDENIANGIKTNLSFVESASGEAVDVIKDGVTVATLEKTPELVKNMENLGYNLGEGLKKGVSDKVEGDKSSYLTIWGKLGSWFKDVFQIHSPSKVFAEYGGYLAAGLYEGTDDGLGDIGTWVNKHVVKPFNNAMDGVLTFAVNVKNDASAWWKSVKEWWSGKVGSVEKFTTDVKDSSSTWWSNVKTWWKSDSKNGVDLKVFAEKGWTGTIKKALGIGDIDLGFKLPKIGINWGTKEIAGFEIKYPTGFYTYAQGGFPEEGQMFIAREAGAELVGNIGGRTAVMNNDQIVESVSTGVYQAVLAALGGNNDNDGNTNIVINLDGEKIYENQQKIARNRGYNMGMGAFSFG